MTEITLRDYFAAHAPAIPDWFEPAMPTKEPFRPGDYGYSETPQQKVWRAARAAQRVIQWPWFYADAMLDARTKV